MELRILRYFVSVAEELHFGRAATRLHLSQPPLSRAIKQLEAEVGALLFTRSPAGVLLTPVGRVLLDEARALLAHADRVRERVSAAAGVTTLTVGILGDGTDPGVTRLAAAFRRRHPGIEIRIRDTDLTDPTCGLRAGLVDVALTRAPFDETALTVRVLRTDQVGAVLRADDSLARCDRLRLVDLSDRSWFQFPQGTDPDWQSYWNGGRPREGPVVRAVQECLQAVLWNGTVGLAPLGHDLPTELAVVPLIDMAPSRVVAVWNEGDTNPLIRSFTEIATAAYRR
ncbi:LysR family transcriptional regulator [Streptomyces stelliscabiei]|uniref:LysR family transcriptional regulator n=1 Tax=Streptomyces stelliscabiei TaxID=146820 RepID=UPI0029BF6315|nr:LysR substrate-binding domain-containing protein [Streptomyces stelliscabiei]MDX2518934.1 LysR substrate-binding domain-containing protein [Streptomyces stelliscabiei]MDX2556434.1 LysR substrate-binding domain-containing protein [Streptomyces stelliscabiei]MDX2615114.1 LysR substrate-binding domain-containing protein [Streptomyces stelliscabiei]MDX2640281.1 LysR substrate-binding domain-containing protein [Streptomyces stelliscabiei]MDX2665798.1 LysR substrate-binding domain-containing prot